MNNTGRMVRGKKRAPKVYPLGRVCASEGCSVKLSRYNRNDHCYNHAPVRYPRVRGRMFPPEPPKNGRPVPSKS